MSLIDNGQFSSSSLSTPRISIVTYFNDRVILEENLLKSLRRQHNATFELIAIDNADKSFRSVPSAYNYGGQRSTGDYIMFVHQDVYLHGTHWLDYALRFLSGLSEIGAIGVSGVTLNGEPKGFILDRGRYWGRRLSVPSSVQTLDEQLILVPRKVFESIKFDERFTFHSYGADYCLSVQNLGLKVYVLPLMIEHNSLTTGTLNAAGLKKQDALLLKKYVNSFKRIHKTTGALGTKRDELRRKYVSFYPALLSTMSLGLLKLWAVKMDQKKVLDVGCIPMEQHILIKFFSKKDFSVGISSKKRYLFVSKKLGIHDDYVVADPEKLPFKAESFDFAFLSGLLEYLPKNKGERIIRASEEVAKGSVIKVPCSGSPIDGTHVIFDSQWSASDFKKKGYRTFAIGFEQRVFPCTLFAYKVTV